MSDVAAEQRGSFYIEQIIYIIKQTKHTYLNLKILDKEAPMRPPKFTNQDIEDMARRIIAEGGAPRPSVVAQRLGGGNTIRIKTVLDALGEGLYQSAGGAPERPPTTEIPAAVAAAAKTCQDTLNRALADAVESIWRAATEAMEPARALLAKEREEIEESIFPSDQKITDLEDRLKEQQKTTAAVAAESSERIIRLSQDLGTTARIETLANPLTETKEGSERLAHEVGDLRVKVAEARSDKRESEARREAAENSAAEDRRQRDEAIKSADGLRMELQDALRSTVAATTRCEERERELAGREREIASLRGQLQTAQCAAKELDVSHGDRKTR